MNIKNSRGGRWLATVSIVTALAITAFYGLRAATVGKGLFDNPKPTVSVASRSEALAGRGYSAAVKRVLPAVVNISSNSGGNQGIGFAVPIDMARHDMDQILAHGKVEHGYLGILPQDVTPALAQAFHAGSSEGALVGEVTPNSPAARSNLKQGDIIVAVNGQPVADANQLRSKIGMMNPNTTVMLKVLRHGKFEEVAAKLGEFPSQEERASIREGNPGNGLQGVTVENLTPETVQELKLPPAAKGVVVDRVNPASRAADAGLKSGDVIQQVNHQAVTDLREYDQAPPVLPCACVPYSR